MMEIVMDSFFTYFNDYYWDSIQKRNNLDDIISPSEWVSSLINFCNYAFERRGSPSAYRTSAIEAYEQNRQWLDSRQNWSQAMETTLFNSFMAECNRSFITNYNERLNPMAPSYGNLISLINFAWNEVGNDSVTGWALNLICSDDIRTAFNGLKRIRGVGDKIASFYLRDIYALSVFHDNEMQDKDLLQPIDVWTERAGKILLNNNNATPSQCADALMHLEDDLELLTGESNIAFWVFGSIVTDDILKFNDAVSAISARNVNNLRNVIDSIINEERSWLTFLESLSEDL